MLTVLYRMLHHLIKHVTPSYTECYTVLYKPALYRKLHYTESHSIFTFYTILVLYIKLHYTESYTIQNTTVLLH